MMLFGETEERPSAPELVHTWTSIAQQLTFREDDGHASNGQRCCF
jgi:hypothetical protein